MQVSEIQNIRHMDRSEETKVLVSCFIPLQKVDANHASVCESS